MASMEEVQSTSQPTIDPQQFQQFSPNDVSTPFTGMIVSQHQDVSIPSDPSSHMHVQMPQLFQSELPPDSVMSMSMHMSLASLPPSTADISAMDVMPSQSSGSPGLIPDLSSQTILSPLTLVSMGSMASKAPTSCSHHPLKLRFGFSSGGSGPPTSVHDPGFQFLPPGFENPLHPAGDNSSDVPGGAHLMVLGDMLKNIARTANSGSEACSMGQSTDAREILGDGSGLSSAQSSPPAVSTVGPNASAVSVVAGMDVGQQLLLNGPSSSGSLDSSAMQDVSELSRKRCASSVAGDRVLKAMKLEPQDDASTLQIPSNPAIAPRSFTTELSSISVPSASVANSRPPSSGGMPSCLPMSLIPDASQQVTPPMHPTLHFSSQQLDHMQSMAPPSDFPSSTSANATSNVLSGSGFNPQIPAGAVWPDGRVTVQRHHQHSLSAGSMLAGMGMTLTGPAPYNAPVFNSPTRSTHAPQPPVPVSIAPAGLVRPSRSTSFSNLHANPFAFTPGAAGDIPPSVYEGFASRPSTSGLHSPRASSPEFDDEYDFGRDSDDDSGDYSPGQYYASAGGGGMGDGMEAKAAMDGAAGASSSNGVARGMGGGQRRMSRTSPSARRYIARERGAAGVQVRGGAHFLRVSPADVFQPKGEPIHQTLMAKKMQRLDESPDFRPFKFRIQAFTNAFLEEVRALTLRAEHHD
ncbi:hypothetical protein A0H81_04278 [Grifola frondosa]|uniref:Uncharacterized protein n=1 Tax=Grifola frondosa TaxID=5627 RepID=A0A1C7MF34_GRIFR|nr:hypothetical protein A0H81_04278 [Grifola frondosa]